MNHQTIQPHNDKAAATWSSGGTGYDNISHFISSAIDHCINRLEPRPGEQILDVATGTGWAARQLAGTGAKVTGVDIAHGLIDAAKQLASLDRLNIDFRVGDADALPFEAGSFDAIISTFGVMFSAKPESAASELARVCKKGGRIGLTTWHPQGNIFGIFKTMKPYQPLPVQPATVPASPFAWGSKEHLTELLGSAFTLKFETGTVFLRRPTGRAAWELFVENYGPTKVLAASLSQERREALKQDFIAFHENFRDELGIAMPCEYLVTIGTRK